MLSIKNLSVRYEDNIALDGVRLDILTGKITGLIGPNGAGKSSLVKACIGLIEDFSGTIVFGEHELHKNRHWVKQHCSYAPEDTILLPYLKGREFLELIGTLRKSDDLETEIKLLFELLKLKDVGNELIVNYSHGMRQKVSIASTLIGNPDYLFFDETLNGLDTISLYNLKKHLNTLAANDKTIILSSHILPLIQEWCDPVIILDQGKVIRSYSKKEILELESKENKTFEEIFIELVNNS